MPKTPKFKVGDLVVSSGSWFLVTAKTGQRCHGRLICAKNGNTMEFPFTSRSVTDVYRRMGNRQKEE